jgi:hypothetical protein
MPLAAGSSQVVAGTLGFLVLAGMAVVIVFLFRSMSKHLRKVNDAASAEPERPGGGAPDSTGPDAAGR